MSTDTGLDLVTGAFSYTGSRIAARLLDSGREVRTLTFHPDRPHPLRGRVETLRYRFDDQVALTESLKGVSTLYNTYWVRFDHGHASFANAIANSRAPSALLSSRLDYVRAQGRDRRDRSRAA